MRSMNALWIGLCFLLLCTGSQTWALQSELQTFSHSQARLVASHNSINTGDTIYLGLLIQLRPKWHTYWMNPGDSGAAPRLSWDFKNSQLETLTPILWPTPERHESSGLVSFAYYGELLLIQKFKITSVAESALIHLKAEWLVCDEVCIPQTAEFQLTLPQGQTQLDPILQPIIENTLSRLPLPLPADAPVSLENTSDQTLTLKVSSPWTWVDFFPDAETNIQLAKPNVISEQDYQTVAMTKNVPTQNHWNGTILVNTPEGLKSYSASLNPSSSVTIWLKFLLAAFLGGILLNLMPCVLPLIALKAFSWVKSSQSHRRQLRWESGAYTLGIVLSLWVLSTAIVLLQKSGRSVGWGFQLQSPIFVAGLSILFILMGLGMLGGIHFGILLPMSWQKSLQRDGTVGAFFSGLLAVIVSSPCTAPFMGAAIGFALSQNGLTIFALFTSLGLGLASPYLLLATSPEFFAKRLPKPGPWMNSVKKFLSLPLFLTAIWLSWIFYQQITPSTLASETQTIPWEEFNIKLITDTMGRKPMFIDFTADWCLSCKVNEKIVFGNQEVIDTLKTKNILLIKADWTNHNPQITEWLQKFNRAGVPFYLMYHSDGSAEILPEILTPSRFLQSLE